MAGLGLGLAWLFQLRLAQDAYPRYSSFRSDPLGVRALHDGLAALPSLRVERWFQPLADLPTGPPRTIFLLGMPTTVWADATTETANALDAAVRGGCRLVVVFAADPKLPARDADEPDPALPPTPAKPPAKPPAPPPETARKRPEREGPSGGDGEKAAPHPPADWNRLWGFAVKSDGAEEPSEAVRAAGALRHAPAPADAPARLDWHGDLHFTVAQGTPWRVLYTFADAPVMMELEHGRGSIVLASDAYFASNEALQKDRATALLAWLAGPHSRLVFVESHLGVLADAGIAALARRYGLTGAGLMLLLLAVLFVWRRQALFVPPPPAADEMVLAYQPTASLEALLQRAVPPAQLLGVCTQEWRRTANAVDRARLGAAAGAARRPAAGYNAAVRALRRK